MTQILYKELSYKIMEAVFEVHNTLGPGFLEKVYEEALVMELRKRGIRCENQKKLGVYYKNELVGEYTADIVVEDKIILELKAVKKLDSVFEAQLLNYLKASKLKLGILLNFAKPKVEYKRIALSQK